jgi:hypothetical protein
MTVANTAVSSVYFPVVDSVGVARSAVYSRYNNDSQVTALESIWTDRGEFCVLGLNFNEISVCYPYVLSKMK